MADRTSYTKEQSSRAARTLIQDYLLWKQEQQVQKERIEAQVKAHWVAPSEQLKKKKAT